MMQETQHGATATLESTSGIDATVPVATPIDIGSRSGSNLVQVPPESTPATTDYPLHDACASRLLEAHAAARLPAHTLMQRAGAAVARLALAIAPHAEFVSILAGPGNNGGDGFEAALHLHRAGKRVRIWLIGDPLRLPIDASMSLQRARSAGLEPQPWCDDANRELRQRSSAGRTGHLVIDALLGRGLGRPAQGDMAQAIEAINRCGAQVLAVDIPSGLPGDTGAPPAGSAWVHADVTVALLSLAPGLFTGQGRDASGTVWWDDLGTDGSLQPAAARLSGGMALWASQPVRRHAQHKGSFGDVRVVGGASAMTGAALLAGRAALRAGAGRVYVHLLDTQAPRGDPVSPELMFGPPIETIDLAPQTTVVAGCGGGTDIATCLGPLIGQAPRLVLDADALNTLAARPDWQEGVRQRGLQGRPAVLTPHPLEAARLLQGSRASVAAVQADRLAAARTLSEQLQAIVVLKGSGTIITAPGQTPWINPTGNAALAVPGSGDVLAGWLAGLWSPLAADADGALAAARRATYLHGLTAELLHPAADPLPASDLAAAIHRLPNVVPHLPPTEGRGR